MAQGSLEATLRLNQVIRARNGLLFHECNALRSITMRGRSTSRTEAVIPPWLRNFCVLAARASHSHNPGLGFLYPTTTCFAYEAGQLPLSVTGSHLSSRYRDEFYSTDIRPQQTPAFVYSASFCPPTFAAIGRSRVFSTQVAPQVNAPYRKRAGIMRNVVRSSPRRGSAVLAGVQRRSERKYSTSPSYGSTKKSARQIQWRGIAAYLVRTSAGTQPTDMKCASTAVVPAPAPAVPLLRGAAHTHGACVLSQASESAREDRMQERAGERATISPSDGTLDLVRENYATAVGVWLLGCCGMMFGIVCWGGYTRLTKSGLSMTDWRFVGARLPTSERSWEEEFTKYKETPEYRDVHYGMSIEEFKDIYFIEWFHRMLGRATGVFFLGGLVIFSLARALSARMMLRLTCLGALGGAQGLVGWWMVRSGFNEPTTEVKTPRVSPYRLAAHLITAMTLYSLTLWQALSVLFGSRAVARAAPALKAAGHTATVAALKKFRVRVAALGALVCTTLISGAFVAGNEAGRAYNTWPKMLDHWIPPEVYEARRNWQKNFESLAVVQFNHRMLAYASTAASALLYLTSRAQPLPRHLKETLIFLPAATVLQALLGIVTLLAYVPTNLGVLHQAGGMTVLTLLTYLLHTASRFRL